MSSLVLSPRIAKGFYPEDLAYEENPVEYRIRSFLRKTAHHLKSGARNLNRIVELTCDHEKSLKGVPEHRLREIVGTLRKELRNGEMNIAKAARSFAVIRELADRRLDMRHYDVQLVGGWVMLNGMVAEMETGEGKTIAATLTAGTAALAGIPVHVITVNDYLARRDAVWMKPIYEGLGLDVGCIVSGMSPENRRKAYHCDITYCTNKEITFDYLKDRLRLYRKPGVVEVGLKELVDTDGIKSNLLMRGLCFAIVDEADSVLVDEARTPLIISGAGNNLYEADVYEQALAHAEKLERSKDFVMDDAGRTVTLLESGKKRLESMTLAATGFWSGKFRREEIVRLALSALHLFERDVEYLVKDGKIRIVDEYTGRIMADRSWERGLHQLIEAKEGCDITPQLETMARISYQRFFRRYRFLAGMTGTAREVRGELWAVYRLHVVAVPTRLPLRRATMRPRLFRNRDEKWEAVLDRIREMHELGRPVLIGTRSVAASEHLSMILGDAGLPHRVLNARQDKEEAEIIAEAGQSGQITVATNMAGRGTDILLDEKARGSGGLYVIATERHSARRIDRQLFGRCGRQGDPGGCELYTAMDDEIIENFSTPIMKLCARRLAKWRNPICQCIANALADSAQKRIEKKHYHIRKELLKFDESLESVLAFSGFRE